MLRLKLCFLTIVCLLIFLFTPRTVESIDNVVRLTATPEQALNLNPTLSDDGRVLVFESSANFFAGGLNDSFHAMRADVRGDPPVFTDLARTRVVSPALSSDGSVVAFASREDLVGENPNRKWEVFLLRHSELTQITRIMADQNPQPSITADGNLVAFTWGRDLFLFDVKTKDFSLVVNGASNPKISGDGSKLYYQRDSDLVLMDLQSRIERIVATDVTGLWLTTGRAVSHDGTRVVYSAEFVENRSQVFLFDARENTTRQLTQLGSRTVDVALQPSISGDGKRVAFATRRRAVGASDGGVELYVYDIPSGQTQQVTNAPSSATAEVTASLNFDGNLVAFSFPRVLSGATADGFENNSEIYLASLAGRPESGTASVLNAASLRTAVAAGSIAVVRGNALAFRTEAATSTELATQMAGTSVTVNGRAARMLFVSPQEVLFVVPEVEGLVDVVVTNADGFASIAKTTILRAAAGVFTIGGDGTGDAVVLDADMQTTAPFDPASRVLRLSIFGTGISNAHNVTAAINGQPLKVEAVAHSGLPGLDEIHVLVPPELSGAGVSTLSVTADGVQSNSTTITIGGSSLRDIVINEFLADPPDGLAGDANGDGVRDSAADEFVELVNSTTRELDLGGYELSSRSLTATNDTLRHRFAPATILPPGQALVIFGGGSPDPHNPLFKGAQIVKASRGSLSLTNTGGVITLRKPTGEIVTSVSYGSDLGLRADLNQSLTRSPDIIGQFVLHSTAAGAETRRFSPGTRIDGSVFTEIVHALSHRRNHFAARALWFRPLPRRPT